METDKQTCPRSCQSICCYLENTFLMECCVTMTTLIHTSVLGHHGGVQTLRLLEGDGQRGATAHAQTDHRRGLRGT